MQQGLLKARCLQPLTQIFTLKAAPRLQTDIFSRTDKACCIFFSQTAAFRKKRDISNNLEKQKTAK